MNDNLLNIKDLSIIYKTDLETVYAVNGLNITLEKGKSLGLVGETGAGKTTSALSIMRLLPERTGHITNGTITFDGKPILELSDKEMREIRGSKISMIFQEPMTSLNPLIKVGKQVEENLLEHMEKKDRKLAKEKTLEMLKKVGLSDENKIYGTYPHQLSGGMRQRIMIAMALINTPELVVADEPTTALDVTIQAQIIELIRELNRQNDTALLLISHDLGLVSNVCEKAYIMYAGEIVESGNIKELIENPRHPYTQGLLNSIPSVKNKGKPLNSIKGFVPSLEERKEIGCAFADRCDFVCDLCRKENPKEIKFGNSMVKCRLYNEKEGENGQE